MATVAPCWQVRYRPPQQRADRAHLPPHYRAGPHPHSRAGLPCPPGGARPTSPRSDGQRETVACPARLNRAGARPDAHQPCCLSRERVRCRRLRADHRAFPTVRVPTRKTRAQTCSNTGDCGQDGCCSPAMLLSKGPCSSAKQRRCALGRARRAMTPHRRSPARSTTEKPRWCAS